MHTHCNNTKQVHIKQCTITMLKHTHTHIPFLSLCPSLSHTYTLSPQVSPFLSLCSSFCLSLSHTHTLSTPPPPPPPPPPPDLPTSPFSDWSRAVGKLNCWVSGNSAILVAGSSGWGAAGTLLVFSDGEMGIDLHSVQCWENGNGP